MAVDAGSSAKAPWAQIRNHTHVCVYRVYMYRHMCIHTHILLLLAYETLPTKIMDAITCSAHCRPMPRPCIRRPSRTASVTAPTFCPADLPWKSGGHHAATDGDWRCLLGTIQNSSPERPCTPGCETEMHPLKTPVPHTYILDTFHSHTRASTNYADTLACSDIPPLLHCAPLLPRPLLLLCCPAR